MERKKIASNNIRNFQLQLKCVNMHIVLFKTASDDHIFFALKVMFKFDSHIYTSVLSYIAYLTKKQACGCFIITLEMYDVSMSAYLTDNSIFSMYAYITLPLLLIMKLVEIFKAIF